MTITQSVLLGLIIASALAVYLPRLFVIHKEKLTRDQFVDQYPEFDWIELDLIIEFFVFTACMCGFAGGFYLLQTPLSLGLFSIVCAGLALWNGLLTAITGVCRIPDANYYYYVHDQGLRRVGWGQVIFSLTIIIAAIVLAQHPGLL